MRANGTIYAVYSSVTISFRGTIEDARTHAEAHAGETCLYRFYEDTEDGARFRSAWYVRDGKVSAWPSVTIPFELMEVASHATIEKVKA